MGVSYSVAPLTEYIEGADGDWLEAIGFEVPSLIPVSRNPTANELRNVLGSLSNYQATYEVGEWTWVATIMPLPVSDSYDGTTIYLMDFDGDENKPLRVVFEKGSDALIIEIAKKLSQLCGPLVVDNDIDGAPLLISSDTDVLRAPKVWSETSRRIDALTTGRIHNSQ